MNGVDHTSGFAPVFNGELYFETVGSGPPLLLIHAGVADSSMWDGQIPSFSQYYQVIRYDTRGFGRSRTQTTEFSNRQDILDLFTHLGVEKACVIGISRGGQIAIDFTLEHPERVSALVAVAAGISGYDYQPDGSEKAQREMEIFAHMDDLWENKEFDQLADLEAHVWADGPNQPIGRASSKIRDYIYEIVRANYIRQDGIATPRPLDPLAVGRLKEIHHPTLILVGDLDGIAALKVADKLEREIPGAKKAVFPGTAHMIPLEQPAKFNQVVLDFLKENL